MGDPFPICSSQAQEFRTRYPSPPRLSSQFEVLGDPIRMPNRPPFSNFRELAGTIADLVPSLRASLRNPRRMGSLLEEYNPWLSRRLLGAASNLADPYVAGMGLAIERLEEDGIAVTMPHRWRNRGEGGVVHVGALTTLAEFTSRLYWERNLNLGRHEMQVVNLAAKFLAEVESDTRATMDFAETEREAALFRFRSEGETLVPCLVKIFESQGRLIAEVTVEWRLTRPMALPSGQG